MVFLGLFKLSSHHLVQLVFVYDVSRGQDVFHFVESHYLIMRSEFKFQRVFIDSSFIPKFHLLAPPLLSQKVVPLVRSQSQVRCLYNHAALTALSHNA